MNKDKIINFLICKGIDVVSVTAPIFIINYIKNRQVYNEYHSCKTYVFPNLNAFVYYITKTNNIKKIYIYDVSNESHGILIKMETISINIRIKLKTLISHE